MQNLVIKKHSTASRLNSIHKAASTLNVRRAVTRSNMEADKTYLTVPELSEKLGADESEILSAIRFGVLEVVRFPVRGARRFRIEEGVARTFARRFYAKVF